MEADKCKSYIVRPEYRDFWSYDPDWDGRTSTFEIIQLAREWNITKENLLNQVEEED